MITNSRLSYATTHINKTYVKSCVPYLVIDISTKIGTSVTRVSIRLRTPSAKYLISISCKRLKEKQDNHAMLHLHKSNFFETLCSTIFISSWKHKLRSQFSATIFFLKKQACFFLTDVYRQVRS